MKNKKPRKPLSINTAMYLTFLAPALILLFILIGSIVLTSIYARTSNGTVLIVYIIYIIFTAFLYVLAMMYGLKGIRSLYIDGLFEVTRKVIKDVEKGKIADERYPKVNVVEFDQLNECLDSLQTTLDNSLLISQNLGNANLPLEHLYDDED